MATFRSKSLCNLILPVIVSELGGLKRDDRFRHCHDEPRGSRGFYASLPPPPQKKIVKKLKWVTGKYFENGKDTNT